MTVRTKTLTDLEGIIESLKRPEVAGTVDVSEVIKVLGRVRNEFFDALSKVSLMEPALRMYGSKSFWTEVPAKTYAANDLGQAARNVFLQLDPDNGIDWD